MWGEDFLLSQRERTSFSLTRAGTSCTGHLTPHVYKSLWHAVSFFHCVWNRLLLSLSRITNINLRCSLHSCSFNTSCAIRNHASSLWLLTSIVNVPWSVWRAVFHCENGSGSQCFSAVSHLFRKNTQQRRSIETELTLGVTNVRLPNSWLKVVWL